MSQPATISDTKRAIDAAELALTKLREMGGLRSRRRSSQDCRRNGKCANKAARMISTETGKPLVQAEREWALSIDQFRWYAEEARRIYGRVIESPCSERSS